MEPHIRLFGRDDLDAIVALSLRAWEPVFVTWQQMLGPELFSLAVFPDWRQGQAQAVQKTCLDARLSTWVAEVNGRVAGFLVVALNVQDQVGEVIMLAVDPEHQQRGIGTALNRFALTKMREVGMKLAVVGTGGDEAHAPARRAYEKVGYTALPIVRYYQAL